MASQPGQEHRAVHNWGPPSHSGDEACVCVSPGVVTRGQETHAGKVVGRIQSECGHYCSTFAGRRDRDELRMLVVHRTMAQAQGSGRG